MRPEISVESNKFFSSQNRQDRRWSAQLPDQWVPSSGEVKKVWICTALFHTPSWRRRKNCIFYVIEIKTNCLGNSNLQYQLTMLLTRCNRPVIIMVRHHDVGQLRDISDVECSRYWRSYGLDGPGLEYIRGKMFARVHRVQNGSVFHPPTYSLGTGMSLPGVKRPESVFTTQHYFSYCRGYKSVELYF